MLSYELNTKALWQLQPELWPIMWFLRHWWRHCDVQWRRTAKNVISLESVDQDLWFDILLDMVYWSLNFSKSLTLNGLNQGQGQRSRSRSHLKLLRTCYHMNLTRKLYDNYNPSYGQLCDFDVIDDVIVTSSDVVRPKKNIFLESVDQDLWFGILLD